MADLKSFKESLFRKEDLSTLPSLACRQRYMDAMLISREFKTNSTDLSRRVEEKDKIRVVRDAFGKLKLCILAGGEFSADNASTKGLPKLGEFLYHFQH